MAKVKGIDLVKMVEAELLKNDSALTSDLLEMSLVVERLCKAYRKLRKLAKNYVQEDDLGTSRKLCDELGIEQWW